MSPVRKSVIAKPRNYFCRKVRRESIAASLEIYPIKDFGTIDEGERRFCRTNTGGYRSMAKVVIVWRQIAARWQITRVLSSGRRALVPDVKKRS